MHSVVPTPKTPGPSAELLARIERLEQRLENAESCLDHLWGADLTDV
ncbi:MAG TPA: hypothetical protein VNG12_12510 [Acidimicrobiales bacterium]|nr:hypothetical protein [Acidimicrobiales bacterium]